MLPSQLLAMIWEKSRLNLKSESSSNYLSYLWWLIDPIVQMLCFYIVFEVLLKRGGPGFVYFLLVGLVPWLWFARCVNQSAMSLLAGKGLMGQIHIPKIFFPSVVILQTTLKQLVIFVVFLTLLSLAGFKPSAHWMSLPLVIITQVLVMYPISLLAALAVLYINDLKFVIPTGIQFLFFFSGIFFDVGIVDEKFKPLLYANPMSIIIDSYRDILLRNSWPNLAYLAIVLTCFTALTYVTVRLYRTHDQRIARLAHE